MSWFLPAGSIEISLIETAAKGLRKTGESEIKRVSAPHVLDICRPSAVTESGESGASGIVARKKKAAESEAAVTGGRLEVSAVDLGELPKLAGLFFRVLSPIMSAQVDRMMAAHPVGTGQGKTSALQVIAKNPGISQMELSEIFGRDRSAQSRIVSDLERRNLIRREIDPTQRHRYKLFATDTGMDLILGLEAMARENERQIFKAISAEEYETMRKLLLRVLRSHLGPGAAYWPGPDDPV